MKLYTEEQLHELIYKYRKNLAEFSLNKPTAQNLIDELTPVTLPTNEEMEERAERNISPFSFIDGAKWMRDKIKTAYGKGEKNDAR